MAIVGNLIVNGAARCLNTLYVNDMTVSGTTTFATLAVTGTSTFTGKAVFNGHLAVGYDYTATNGTLSTHGLYSNEWLRSVGNIGWFSQTYGGGIYMKDNKAIRTYGSKNFFVENGNLYVGPTTTDPTASDALVFSFKSDGSLTASSINASSETVDNLQVTETLKSFKWDIQHVANLGGDFLVTPTYIASASATISSLTISGTTVTMSISDASAITSDSLGGAQWLKGAKVKVSGEIGGVVIGTCEGSLTTNMNATSGVLTVQFTYPDQDTNPLNPNNVQIKGITVMLTQVVVSSGATTTYPVGIYITSYEKNAWPANDSKAKPSISIYGGTATTAPVARIGSMAGLAAIGGKTPSGWGIYTSNGYFSGTVVANYGTIAGWRIEPTYLASSNATAPAANVLLLSPEGTSSSYTVAGKASTGWMITAGTTFGVNKDGGVYATSGTIGSWNIATNTLSTGTWGSNNSAMLCTGTQGSRSIGGSADTVNGWVFTAGANFGVTNAGAMYCNSAHVAGEITATSGTIGGWTANSSYGLYTNSKTSATSTNAGILIQKDGGIYAGAYNSTNAACPFQVTSAGALTAISGRIGKFNLTNTYLYTGSGSTQAGMGGNQAFWAGSTDSNSAPFRVGYDGSAVFTNATLGDPSAYHVTIDSDSLDVMNYDLKLASFGEVTVVGQNEGRHIQLGEQGLIFYDADDNSVFSVSAHDVTDVIYVAIRQITTKGNYYVSMPSIKNGSSFSVKINDRSNNLQTLINESFTHGTAKTVNNSTYNINIIYTHGDTILVVYNGTTTRNWEVSCSYRRPVAGAPVFTLGKRISATPSTHGNYSTVIGLSCEATGEYSYAEGYSNHVTNECAHAEGRGTTASGKYSHAQGQGATASNDHAFASGSGTTASGAQSQAHNLGTMAIGNQQTAIGKYNVSDTTSAFIIGNGAANARSNALTIDWSGNADFSGTVKTKKFNQIITGTGTAASDGGASDANRYKPAKWTFNTGMTVSDGDIITIKIPVAGHDYGVFVSINNGTNYYPVACNGRGRLTTHYPAGSYLTLVYESAGIVDSMFPLAGGTSRVSITGIWRVINFYDSNSDYGYYHRRIYPNLKAGAGGIVPYTLIMQTSNGRWSSIVTSSISSGTTPKETGKAVNTNGFMPGRILLMYANASYSDGGNIGTYNIWSAYTGLFDARYSLNLTSSAGLTAYTPVYIIGTLDSNGLFKLDTTKWWAQALPNSDDGKLYTYIGDAYDWYRITLTEEKPTYWYKNGKVQLYSGASAYALESATASSATSSISSKYLMNRGSNVTIADSSWNHGQTGSGGTNTANGTVWHQRWKQSGLTYTPSGGSATTLSDSADMVLWLAQSATSNSLTVNMAIDGLIYAMGGFKGSLNGNASTATKLASTQKVYVTLGTASTTTTIQGGSSSAQTIGVDGTLAVGNGGTGKTTGVDAANYFLNELTTGSSDAQAADYLIAQYAGGGTTTTTYHRRPVNKVVNATVVKAALGTNATHGNTYLRKDGTWQTPPYPVTSVAGKTGAVTLAKGDVGLGNVDNKSSATIRGEITSSNVTTALGFTPLYCDTVYTESASTYSYSKTLVNGGGYLLIVTKLNSTTATYNGLYLISAQTTNSALVTIASASSSLTSISVSGLTLSASVKVSYVKLDLIKLH